jgi:hypothetical protein
VYRPQKISSRKSRSRNPDFGPAAADALDWSPAETDKMWVTGWPVVLKEHFDKSISSRLLFILGCSHPEYTMKAAFF